MFTKLIKPFYSSLKDKIYKNEIWIVIAVFIVGVIGHFLCSDFIKRAIGYPDELRYLDIAHYWQEGIWLSIRNTSTDFQKITYSLLISPFFAINDELFRIKLLSLFNCIIISSSIFPVYGICKKLKLNLSNTLLVLLITILWPDMMFSMTFMSENLFWPLTLLYIYMLLTNQHKQSYLLAVFLGFLGYIGYCCKEIFLALFLAHCFFIVSYPLLEKVLSYICEEKRAKNKFFSKQFILFIITIAIFSICFVIMKCTLFHGMGNSYSQMGIEAILPIYNRYYAIYGIVYYIMATIVCGFIFPFVYPVIDYKKLSITTKKLFLFTIGFILASIITISYTILIRENLGEIEPRVHFRYFGPAFICCFMVLFAYFQNITKKEINENKKTALILLLFWLLAICFVVKIGTGVRHADQYVFGWYSYLYDKIGVLKADNMMTIYVYAIVANTLIVLLALIFHYVYSHFPTKITTFVFAAIVCCTSLINDCFAYKNILVWYMTDKQEIQQVVRLNDFFANRQEKNILYVTGKLCDNKSAQLMDTYFNHIKSIYYISLDDFKSLKALNKVEDTVFKASYPSNPYPKLTHIDYIIYENNNDFKFYSLDNAIKIEEISGNDFTVYQNLNPEYIKLKTNPKQIVYLYGEKYNADDYITKGISHPEKGFSWTQGEQLQIKFKVPTEYAMAQIIVYIEGTFNGNQRLNIVADNKIITKKVIQGKETVEFSLPITSDEINVLFMMPDAKIVNQINPQNPDMRQLALRFSKMIITLSEGEK